MKLNRRSRLFFLVLCSALLGCSIPSFAQTAADSTAFYSSVALQPQNAEALFKAQDYFNRSYDMATEKGDVHSRIHSLYYKASIQYRLGEFDSSEGDAVEALKLLNTLVPSAFTEGSKKSLFNLLGLMYSEQKNKGKAISLYETAFSNSKTAVDSATIYNNIALVHKNFEDYQKAKEAILKAYQFLPRIKDTTVIALITDNYGTILTRFHSEDALALMTEALKLRKTIKDSSKIFTSYVHLADYYESAENKEAAKSYALKALDFANHLKNPSYRKHAYKILTKLNADVYGTAYLRLSDSLEQVENANENAFALIKYDYSEYKRKALENALAEARQRNLKLLYMAIGGAILLISIFLYVILRVKHKKEKLQQVYITETRISKKVHDEVANDIYHIMTKLQGAASNPEVLLDDLEDIYNRTRDISKENSAIELKENFEVVLNDLLYSFKTDEVNIITKGSKTINWNQVPALTKTAIYRVLQELMTNMRKHSKATLVVISWSQASKTMSIQYIDNGVGCSLQKGNGLHNTENRIHSINGSITFDTDINKGFKATISV